MSKAERTPSSNRDSEGRSSSWWYLLPIFFGIIGGLIMFFVLKDEDRRKAKNGVKLGVILTVAGIVLYFAAVAAVASLVASEQAAAEFEEGNEAMTRQVDDCINLITTSSGNVRRAPLTGADPIMLEGCDGLLSAMADATCSKNPDYDVCKDGSIERYFELREEFDLNQQRFNDNQQ